MSLYVFSVTSHCNKDFLRQLLWLSMNFIIAVFESKFSRDVHNNTSTQVSLIFLHFQLVLVYTACPDVIPPFRSRDEICTRENKPILSVCPLWTFPYHVEKVLIKSPHRLGELHTHFPNNIKKSLGLCKLSSHSRC